MFETSGCHRGEFSNTFSFVIVRTEQFFVRSRILSSKSIGYLHQNLSSIISDERKLGLSFNERCERDDGSLVLGVELLEQTIDDQCQDTRMELDRIQTFSPSAWKSVDLDRFPSDGSLSRHDRAIVRTKHRENDRC